MCNMVNLVDIGTHKLGPGHPCFVIAEAGVNHNGSLDLAFELVDAAIRAGADAVKFQAFQAKNLVSKGTPKADYQKETTGGKESQFDLLKSLELGTDEHRNLQNYCRERNIVFLSSPFDIQSGDFLDEIDIPAFKIPSGEITNWPFLKHLAGKGRTLILSTGMSNLGDIEGALQILEDGGLKRCNVVILHCNTEYPTPFEDVNLRAMKTIGRAFQVVTGYSDHTRGIEVAVAAVALGACVIEKHLTLDRTLSGPDHQASIEEAEFLTMVKAIRNVEQALGSSLKVPSESEKRNMAVARKSLVAACDIREGEVFSEDNLTVKRPGTGIDPRRWQDMLGQKASRTFCKDELI